MAHSIRSDNVSSLGHGRNEDREGGFPPHARPARSSRSRALPPEADSWVSFVAFCRMRRAPINPRKKPANITQEFRAALEAPEKGMPWMKTFSPRTPRKAPPVEAT